MKTNLNNLQLKSIQNKLQYNILSKMTKDELILFLIHNFGNKTKLTAIANEARKHIKNWSKEHVIIVALTYKRHILGSKLICIGNEWSVENDFNDAFKYLMKIRAARFYHIHNHPFNLNLYPSKDDKIIKRRYEKLSDLMCIQLEGSMIINQLNEVLF